MSCGCGLINGIEFENVPTPQISMIKDPALSSSFESSSLNAYTQYKDMKNSQHAKNHKSLKISS